MEASGARMVAQRPAAALRGARTCRRAPSPCRGRSAVALTRAGGREGRAGKCVGCAAKSKKAASASVEMDDFVEEYEYAGDALAKKDGDVEEEEVMKVSVSMPQVQSIITNLCETTDIAEVDLRIGDFELYVLRRVKPEPAVAPAPAAVAPAAAAPPAPAPSAPSLDDHSHEDEDHANVVVTSDVVGTLRRGRYVKSKQVSAKPMVVLGDTVKKGQTIAFVEQMGTYAPILASQAGEITSFEVDEGHAVGYGQAVVQIHPFFGGHIIGESKHV